MSESPRPRILIVDDQAANVNALCETLRSQGYETVGFTDGNAALGALRTHKFELLLTDLAMPGMSGVDLLRAAQQHNPDLVGVIMTGEGSIATAVAAMKTGALDYILKPLKLSVILPVLSRALTVRRLRIDNAELERSVRDRTKELETALRALEEQTAQRLKVEQALRQAQRLEAVGQLTGGIAHDFNNLLMIIVGSLSLLKERIGDKPHVKLVSSALNAADRCSNLTRQLLSFGRRQMVRPERRDMNELLRGCDQLVRSAAGQLVQVRYQLQAEPAICSVDREEFERAVLNISINARQAMLRGGTLTVQTDTVLVASPAPDGTLAPGDYFRIVLRDTGLGMPQDVLRRAFDPFFTTKKVGEGSGLGLSQAYGFAKQSGGHAAIESAVGVGTAVTLYLPLAVADREAAEIAAERTPLPPIAATVLLVDDTEDVLETITSMLEALGCTVLQARSGSDGLTAVRAHGTELDLLLIDVVLPGGVSGNELAKEAVRICPTLSVMLMTGNPNELDVGGDHMVLRKPFDRKHLEASVRAVLRKRRAGRWS